MALHEPRSKSLEGGFSYVDAMIKRQLLKTMV